MIIFPSEVSYTIHGDSVGETCKKKLEETLRILGNFKEEPIHVTEYESGKNTWDVVCKVKDLDNTLFTFLNFKAIGSTSRFIQNYQLTMKKEKSNFCYKYDFYDRAYNDKEIKLTMIEVSCPLTENRVMRLQTNCLSIEEGTKEYVLAFKGNNETKSLEDFESMVIQAMNIQTLNLENILTIIKNPKQLDHIRINRENKPLATVVFYNNNIYEYWINEPFRTIRVTMGDVIKREVTRNLNGETVSIKEELTEDTYEKLQSDYKILFKQL